MRGDGFFDGDADIEQAELEQAGRSAARGHRRMLALRAAGKLAEAARACSHGWGYPTNSPAAANANDPRAGQKGHRCLNCGSWFSGEQVRGDVPLWELRDIAPAVPCELEARS